MGHDLRTDLTLPIHGRGKDDPPVPSPCQQKTETMPARIAPMLPTLVEATPRGDDWAFEVKWDGVRAISYMDLGKLRVESRNLLEITLQYPELRELALALGEHRVVLDGEIITFDEDGRPSFERLQQRMGLSNAAVVERRRAEFPAVYVVFDVLFLDGETTIGLEYRDRRALLAQLVSDGPCWLAPAFHVGDGAAYLQAAKAGGLEGVVGKRLDSTYEPGRRTRTWVKVKNVVRQEFVIGGYTPGEGSRSATLGALLIGYYDGDQLRFAGRVGTGLTEATMNSLLTQLGAIQCESSPFVSGAFPRGSRFVEPLLVAEVAFTEWTAAGIIRHPVFKGLRRDKSARDVIRERPGRVL
jgi:bifunctional non-homologous end joining protein LigD